MAWKDLVDLALPTLGGKQIWADELIAGGWRLQRNVLTDRYRLLDPSDKRRSAGDAQTCRALLEMERRAGNVPTTGTRILLLVHGLGRSTGTFNKLKKALVADGREAYAISYPSTLRTVSDHARQLETILGCFDGVEHVSFVTHSMGGLVVRELLARQGSWRDRIDVERVVMIAPPNRGSAIARLLSEKVLKTVTEALDVDDGRLFPSINNLTPEHAATIPQMKAEFGIIAGVLGNGVGYNPLLDGDNDGIVTVEETKLEGYADFVTVRSSHTPISSNAETIRQVLFFLKTGHFNHTRNNT